ncbi:MAG TPA: hypothetical protein VH164_05375 [Ktedonobacteraceae bacterium]|nr:hypothetical protein [Ktedonobacteraceae bacterium]
MNTILCTATTGWKRCNRLALFHCSGCGRALCERHAIRLPSFGRNSWVCAACRQRHYTDPKRRLSILHW